MLFNNYLPIGKVVRMEYVDKKGKKQTTYITRRSGKKIKVKSITIHNNGNKDSTPDNERNWLVNPSNTRSASWNECLNENGSVVAIPWGEESYHSNTTKGNRESYSIEVCERNFDKVYPKAVSRVAELLFENNLTVNNVTTHQAWSGKNCPSLLLPIWTKFISDISYELNLLKNPVDEIKELVEKVVDMKIISTSTYWEKVIKGEVVANPDYVKALFENIVKKK